MPVPKSEFDDLYPCDFYTPAELLDAEDMYTVYEIARLLQGLEPDAEIDVETEEILLDWAIPWIVTNAEDLVIAEPRTEEEPGYYGRREAGASDAQPESPPPAPSRGDDNHADGEDREGDGDA